MCSGYFGQPEASAAVVDAEGWFHTGDLARCDDEWYFFIVDRKKDMFISGGENIYPAEIEQALYKHPAVLQCAVIGVPDAKWGEVGLACVGAAARHGGRAGRAAGAHGAAPGALQSAAPGGDHARAAHLRGGEDSQA